MLFSVPDFIGFACREVGKINKVIVHTVSSLEPDPSVGGGRVWYHDRAVLILQ